MNKEFRCGDVILNCYARSGYPTSIFHGYEYEEPFFIDKDELMLVIEVGNGEVDDGGKEMRVITSKGVMWTCVSPTDSVSIEHTNI